MYKDPHIPGTSKGRETVTCRCFLKYMFWKTRRIHRKTPELVFVFNQAAGVYGRHIFVNLKKLLLFKGIPI